MPLKIDQSTQDSVTAIQEWVHRSPVTIEAILNDGSEECWRAISEWAGPNAVREVRPDPDSTDEVPLPDIYDIFICVDGVHYKPLPTGDYGARVAQSSHFDIHAASVFNSVYKPKSY